MKLEDLKRLCGTLDRQRKERVTWQTWGARWVKTSEPCGLRVDEIVNIDDVVYRVLAVKPRKRKPGDKVKLAVMYCNF